MVHKKIKELIGKNNYKFSHIKSTTSTMIKIKDLINRNNKNYVLLSDQQTKGRGRRGRFVSAWVSF